MCTYRVKTEDGGFDEMFAVMSGTIKYLETNAMSFGFQTDICITRSAFGCKIILLLCNKLSYSEAGVLSL
jgi:hypothetical protein